MSLFDTSLAHAQSPGAAGVVTVPGELTSRPVPLRAGRGEAHETVTTSSPEAQAFYDQGLAYLHSFFWIEAARSFRQAFRLDSKLAMACVGLSYAMGQLGSSAEARAESARASALADRASDLEKVRIDLRARQLKSSAEPMDAGLHSDYVRALDEAVRKHPDDVELLLLKGNSDEPGNHSMGTEIGSGSITYYERAARLDPRYFAPHHYLIHAYENAGRPDLALEHAWRYVEAAPQVPHAHHMYGHVLRRLNRTAEAIAEFRRADELELDYFRAEKITPQYDWHYQHNLELLGTSYEYAGRMSMAEAALKRFFEVPTVAFSSELHADEWPAFLLAQGRPDEALAAAGELASRPSPLVQALGHLMRSRALMALKRMKEAAEAGNRALVLMRSTNLGGALLPEFQLTQGEFLLLTRDSKAIGMLQDGASKLADEIGPDAWVHTLFSLEAAFRVASELRAWDLATLLAQKMRACGPEYGGTHYVTGRVLEEQGDLVAARTEYMRAVKSWILADPELPILRAARQRLASLR